MTMFYRTYGKSTNPCLVFLHGYPNDGQAWDMMISKFEQDYFLIIPDLLGSGKSPLPDQKLTLQHQAEAIHQVLEKEQIDKAIFIGHSMGGYVALVFGSMYADKLTGVSLVHSSMFADSEEKKKHRQKSLQLMQNGNEGKRAFVEAMAGNLFAPDFAASNKAIVQQIIDNGMRLPTEQLAALYVSIMERTDQTEWARNTSSPIQFIIGKLDNAIVYEESLKQCPIPPVADVKIYADCGHMSMYEQPEILTNDLLRFFIFCLKK